MSRYAAKTEVPVSKTRMEIEKLVTVRYGAGQYLSGIDVERAFIGFTMNDRQVRFLLTLPSADEKRFTTYKDRYGYDRDRSEDSARKEWEQEIRSRWRALLLVIKAKLEAVEVGIATFEDEFLANIVMPDGNLVGHHIRPRIAEAYASGNMPPMLPDFSDGRGE